MTLPALFTLSCLLSLAIEPSIQPPRLSPSSVDIETIDGSLRAELPSINAETVEISLQNRIYQIRDILSVKYRNDQIEAQPRDLLVLRNQSRWRGNLLLKEDRPEDTIQWTTPSLQSPLTVSLDDLVLYLTTKSPAIPFPDPDPDSDQLLTEEGATLTGILEELTPNGIRFDDPSLGSLVLPWPKVVAFRLVEVPTDSKPVQSQNLPIQIRTVDQSIVHAHLLLLSPEKISFSRFTGELEEFPLSRVNSVRFELGRVASLSQREPISVTEGAPTTTWFPWTWKKDQNVLGNPMQIGGIGYETGIGVHSRSQLTYAVESGDQFLVGIAGMDISSRPPDQQEDIGCAEFRILVDGTESWNGGVLSWKSPGKPFRIPVKGAKSFSLIVDLGPGHHILDRANWAQIRMIRE